MDTLDSILKNMTFDFFGSGQHKIEMETLLEMNDAIFLDVRSKEEVASLEIKLQYHIPVLWIPIDEIPARYGEIPKDKMIGVFCSAGTRSTLVYLYLLSKGYERVRIAPSSYEALTKNLLPGKLHKKVKEQNMAKSQEI